MRTGPIHWAPVDKDSIQCYRPRLPGELSEHIENVTCTGCKSYYRGRMEETPLSLARVPNIITITYVEDGDHHKILSCWENPNHVPGVGHFRAIDGILYYLTRVIHSDPIPRRDATHYPVTCYLKRV